MFLLSKRLCCYTTVAVVLAGCGGSGADRDVAGPGGTANTQSAQAFAKTVYPLLVDNCGACHADGNAQNIKFAAADVQQAHDNLMAAALVNFEKPSVSKLVQRLAADQHFCWTTCGVDAGVVATEIKNWDEQLSPTTTLAPDVQTFSETVYPVLAQYCAACHNENSPNIAIAHSSVSQAYNEVTGKNKVDLDNPAESRLVLRLSADSHYCWSDCANDGSVMLQAVIQWAGDPQTPVDPTPVAGPNTAPVAVGDAAFAQFETTGIIGDVTLNDVDKDGDRLVISGFDSSTANAGSVESNSDGTFTYTPPDNFIGLDSFEYIVTDGRGGADVATVTIAVVQNDQIRDDNRFLQFINQSSPFFTETAATAAAYYQAVDPLNERATLQAWRIKNGFNIGADAFAVYINNADLGFARRMFIRTDPITGVVSSYVENYANLNDAVARQNLIATVAMEYTVAPGKDPQDLDNQRFATFYVYNGNGNRDLGADLDGRGFKFVPGLCNTCHGGRPQPVLFGAYPENGNTGATFLPWDLDTYLFGDGALSRAAQEDQFKILNQSIMATNITPAQRELIEGWYGGSGFIANFNGSFVPPGWSPPAAPANATQLYLQVVAPYCRTCHAARGQSPRQNDIDFSSYAKFISYRHRIDELVFDQSVMPMALQTFNAFWNSPNKAETLARFIESSRLLSDGEVLKPGRLIANVGPLRESALGRVDLNGNGSLFDGGANAFNWSLLQRPANSFAVLENGNTATPFFIADEPGDYTLQLVVNDNLAATPPSPPAELVVRVSPELRAVSFVNDVAPIFGPCAQCHTGFDLPKFSNINALYDSIINFVDINDPVNSRLLTQPSSSRHGGGVRAGFETRQSPNYQTVLRWIQEGAREN